MAVELPKLERMFIPIDSGKITTPIQKGQNALSDQTKMWRTNVFVNHLVRVTDPSGRREIELVAGNAGSTIVIRDTWSLSFPAGSDYEILAVNLMQALRDVFGGGSDISAANPLEVHDPKVGSLVSYEGTTTADGAPGGTTLVCSDLTTKPDYDGNLVIITSGDYAGQARDINGATTGGTVTPASAFGGQIVSGVTFVIVGIRTVPAEVAALMADVGDASASTLGSLYAILGNPAQTFLAMIGYEGATALANKLTAARAALLDEITAGRMSELDAGNIPADIDTLLTRLSAVRAGYLDNLSAGAVALASVCTAARLGELDAANIPADIDTLLSRVTAAVALASVCTEARLAELDAANIPTDLAAITAYVDELETRLSAVRAGYLDELGPTNVPADIDTLLARVTAAVALASVCTEARLAELDAANIPADTDPRVMGRTQIFEKSITSAANAGDVLVATVTTQPCLIESVVIHADAAQTADMTSCGVFGGAGKVITFISAADAVRANLDAADKQVAWVGAVRLAATKTIVISLVGTGATAVDLTIVVKYRACASGGYLA